MPDLKDLNPSENLGMAGEERAEENDPKCHHTAGAGRAAFLWLRWLLLNLCPLLLSVRKLAAAWLSTS